MDLKIKGPSSVTVMYNEKENKKVILLGDIHVENSYDKKACANFIVPDKKIDYFIEYSYDMDLKSENTGLLKEYAKCILKNENSFNPYLIDYRKSLNISNVIFLFVEFLNSKLLIDGEEVYRTEELLYIMKKLSENLKYLNKDYIRSSLKVYFDIVNKNNNLKLKPTKELLSFYLNSTKELGDIDMLLLPFIKEYENLFNKLNTSSLEYISAKTVNAFFLRFIKLYRYLATITEKIFDTYLLSGILQSKNDIIIVHTGQQHIDTYIKFLKSNGYQIEYKLDNDLLVEY
jgi:hypothetical protein